MFDFLFEEELKKDDKTKLSTGEKVAGGLGIAGGLGAAGYGHYKLGHALKTFKDDIKKQVNPTLEYAKRAGKLADVTKELNPPIHQRKITISKLEKSIKNFEDVPSVLDKIKNKAVKDATNAAITKRVGLGVAGTVAAGLAAHKLYKMYKNKKK